MDDYPEFETASVMEKPLHKPESPFFIKERLTDIKPRKNKKSNMIPTNININYGNINYYPSSRRYSNSSMMYEDNNIYINPIYSHSKKISNGSNDIRSLYNSNSLNYDKIAPNPTIKYNRINIHENEPKSLPIQNNKYNNPYRSTRNNSCYEIKLADNRKIHSFHQNQLQKKIQYRNRMLTKTNPPKCTLSYRNLNNMITDNYPSSRPLINQNKQTNYLLRQKKYIVVDDNNEGKSFNNYISTYNDRINFENFNNYNSKIIENNHTYNNLDEIDSGIRSTKNLEDKRIFIDELHNTKTNKVNVHKNLIAPIFYSNLDNLNKNSNFKENHTYHETNESNSKRPYEIIDKNLSSRVKLNNNFSLKNLNKMKLSKIPKSVRLNDSVKKLKISKEKVNNIKNVNQLINTKKDNHSYYEIRNIKKKKNEKMNSINNTEIEPEGFIMNDDAFVRYYPYVSKSPYKFYRKRGVNSKNKNRVSCYVYTEMDGDTKNSIMDKKTHTKRYSNNVVYHVIEDFKKELKKKDFPQKVL